MRRITSDQILKDLKAVTIKLESGQCVELCLSTELYIPREEEALQRAIRTSPGRIAFWSYQEERALRDYSDYRRNVRRVRAATYLAYKKMREQDDALRPTETALKEDLAIDKALWQKKKVLSRLRSHYNLLRAIRRALEHRHFALGHAANLLRKGERQ
jgi:hypothetical protein